MTDTERAQIVAEYGFTERQARFLVLVIRHAGLCVKRQYATFAGIANGGEKCNRVLRQAREAGLCRHRGLHPQPREAVSRSTPCAVPRHW